MKDTAARSLLILVSITAFGYSALLIAADYQLRQQTVASLGSAARLVPFNADYLISLAELKPQESGTLLRQAVKWNPFIADVWARLALQSEIQSRDIEAAERSYLKAASVNHMYMPKWTLANFYFWQRDKNKFFAAAKSALEVTPYDSDPLFAEAYALNADDDKVFSMIPQRPEVAFSYLEFVLSSNRLSAIEPAALKAVSFRPPPASDESGRLSRWTALLGHTEDRLIWLNRPDAAVRVLERMHQADWVQMPAPSPSSPLLNASFRFPISGRGFDWLLNPTAGVTADQMPESQSLRFNLSGTQPEQCRLLQQVVMLRPGRDYRFSWQEESFDFKSGIGLTWKLIPLGQAAGEALVSSELFQGREKGTWNFTPTSNSQAFLLTLELKRPLGQVRAEGTFSISGLSLVPGRDSASNLSVRGFAKR